MNYFAHGLRFLDRPYYLAGTAVPDWLSVVDRRVRMRPRYVTPHVTGDGSIQAEVAGGVMQHLDDDARFHGCRAFVEISSTLAVAFRETLPDGDGYRPGFLGHVAAELILDGLLIERDPGRLEAYYEALEVVDAGRVQEAVNRMARGGTTRQLALLIAGFRERRFLGSYVDPSQLLARLNQVLLRIRLSELPGAAVAVIERGREIVEPRVSELLGWSPEDLVRRPVESPVEGSGAGSGAGLTTTRGTRSD